MTRIFHAHVQQPVLVSTHQKEIVQRASMRSSWKYWPCCCSAPYFCLHVFGHSEFNCFWGAMDTSKHKWHVGSAWNDNRWSPLVWRFNYSRSDLDQSHRPLLPDIYQHFGTISHFFQKFIWKSKTKLDFKVHPAVREKAPSWLRRAWAAFPLHSAIMFFLSCHAPMALSIYWITSAGYSLVSNLVFLILGWKQRKDVPWRSRPV